MSNKITTVLLIAIVPAILFVFLFFDGTTLVPFVQEGQRTIVVGNFPVQVEVADTPAARERGLSGRESLATNAGMLFVFDELGAHGFWMKDMKFPIDIIWMAPAGDESAGGGARALRIVDIKQNAQPDSFPQAFFPRESALYVLEVNAGFTDTHSIQVGDPARI